MWYWMCYFIGIYCVIQYSLKIIGSNYFNKRKGEKICMFVYMLIILGCDLKSDFFWLMVFDLF